MKGGAAQGHTVGPLISLSLAAVAAMLLWPLLEHFAATARPVAPVPLIVFGVVWIATLYVFVWRPET